MQNKLRATYENGVFIPVLNSEILNLPESAEVEITIETIFQNGSDASEQSAKLREIAESMRANAFTGNPPRFSREELHERR